MFCLFYTILFKGNVFCLASCLFFFGSIHESSWHLNPCLINYLNPSSAVLALLSHENNFLFNYVLQKKLNAGYWYQATEWKYFLRDLWLSVNSYFLCKALGVLWDQNLAVRAHIFKLKDKVKGFPFLYVITRCTLPCNITKVMFSVSCCTPDSLRSHRLQYYMERHFYKMSYTCVKVFWKYNTVIILAKRFQMIEMRYFLKILYHESI